MLRVAIVHYHLRPGGVTRVVEHAQRALEAAGVASVVLTGEPPQAWPAPVRVVDGLGYDEGRSGDNDGRELATRMAEAAREALGRPPDLYHFHNHGLGKNLGLLVAIGRLLAGGCRLLLQVHDFAEDGRPGNYRRLLHEFAGGDARQLARMLYPDAPQVHYGVLNRRDHAFLLQAGLSPSRLHLLPNPVRLPQTGENGQEAFDRKEERLYLYPTRAIRRKNVGELVLWAALGAGRDRFATTLAPENPAEYRYYRRWPALAAELGLPVEFDLAGRSGTSFTRLLAGAHGLVTTSVAEGFGLAFLEPWLAGRPVLGRDLPEITREFREEGVRLPYLYPALWVPVAWIGRDRLLDRAATAVARAFAAYGRAVPANLRALLESAWIQEDRVDFGRLDEAMQETVIRRVAADRGQAAAMIPPRLPGIEDAAAVVAANQRVLAARFGLEAYGRRLVQAYEQVAGAACGPALALAGGRLLDAFLDPARLTLLRME